MSSDRWSTSPIITSKFVSSLISDIPGGGRTTVAVSQLTTLSQTYPDPDTAQSVTTSSTTEPSQLSQGAPDTSKTGMTSSSRTFSSPTTTSRMTSSSRTTSSPKTTSGMTSSTANASNTTIPAHRHLTAPGVAVGIGVGSAVAGALMAALILWFLMRKHRERSQRAVAISKEDPKFPPMLQDKKIGAALVQESLPQPLDDRKIRDEFSTIGTVINSHVRSYYHTAPSSVNIEDVNQAALDILGRYAPGRNAPMIASTLTNLLSSQGTRLPALRFCIAWIVVSSIELDCPTETTFLPREIARCLESMSALNNDQQTLLSMWRAITAALLQKTYGDTLSRADSRHGNIQNAKRALNQVLQPYADQSRDTERVRNLEEILKRGARVGFLLFSEPSVWEFDWDRPKDVKAGAMTIFPALIQVGDNTGQVIGTPRVLVDGEAA